MKMINKFTLAALLVVTAAAGCSPTGPVFSVQDRAGLGAFLAFEIVANDAPNPTPDGGATPAGDWCDECTPGGVPLYPSHPGKVGDGTIFTTCPVCGGTQKAPSMGESHAEKVRKAGEVNPPPMEEYTFEDAVKDITEIKQPAWTIEDKLSKNASNADIREHLISVHDIDPDSVNKMSREELLSLHDLLHNAETRSSAPTSSCPSGNCPTSRSSSSSCPSGNCPTSSRSTRSRGLFGRWR